MKFVPPDWKPCVRPARCVAFLIAGVTAGWMGVFFIVSEIQHENGPMENFQVACLILGIGAWLLARRASSNEAERFLFGALAFFYLIFLVLEVDTKQSGIEWLIWIFNGAPRDIWLTAFILIILIRAFPKRERLIQRFMSWLSTPAAPSMLCAGVFWLLSGLVDKTDLIPYPDWKLLVEELLEANAVVLMLHSAWRSLVDASRARAGAVTAS